MGSTIIDSTVFRHIFSTEAMRRVFSDENRTQKYLDIEVALARVQARLGIIPRLAGAEIERQARVEKMDFAKLKAQTERIGYPVLPVVQQLVELCSDGLGEYCHWGATTQDITDTATVLQIREALVLIEDDLDAISVTLADVSLNYRDTPMAGCSNLQQAVPVSFGYKAAVLLAAIERHRARLRELRPRVLVGEFGGAAGTLASLGNDGLRVQAVLMQELGLAQPLIAWHTARDCFAEVGCFLGLVTGTLGKVATDVKLMMQTEVGEVFEPFEQGRGSSSTMPQKRNPKLSQDIVAAAAQIRALVPLALEAMQTEHEADRTTSIMMSRALVPACELTGDVLQRMIALFDGLQVFPERMRQNLDLSGGLIMAEALMLELGRQIGRQRAHDAVYDAAQAAVTGSRPFRETLASDPHVSARLTPAQLDALLDPAPYTGLCRQFAERGAATARETAAALARGVSG